MDSRGGARKAFRLDRSTPSARPGAGDGRKNLFSLLLWPLSEGFVSHHPVSLTASQEGVQTGIGTERGKFKLKTVTVYKIEALIEKRKLGQGTVLLLWETFLGWSCT